MSLVISKKLYTVDISGTPLLLRLVNVVKERPLTMIKEQKSYFCLLCICSISLFSGGFQALVLSWQIESGLSPSEGYSCASGSPLSLSSSRASEAFNSWGFSKADNSESTICSADVT